MDQTWSTKRGPTGLRGRLTPVTFLGREGLLLVGSIRPGISGSSVGLGSTRAGQGDRSTTCGSTSRSPIGPARGEDEAAQEFGRVADVIGGTYSAGLSFNIGRKQLGVRHFSRFSRSGIAYWRCSWPCFFQAREGQNQHQGQERRTGVSALHDQHPRRLTIRPKLPGW